MAYTPDTVYVQIRADTRRVTQPLDQAHRVIVATWSKVECLVCSRPLKPDRTHVWG